MATAGLPRPGLITLLGDYCVRALVLFGDFLLFSLQSLSWILRRWPARRTILPNFYVVGARSVPVVCITGLFIGMVMAVQTYHQFNRVGLANRLGAMIDITIVRELGPVLAATMLAGRVGSAMAAELATMRITEQVDALACLGAHPLHYLVVPRVLACTLLIPLLTIFADTAGILGGAVVSIRVYHIEAHFYWQHAREYVQTWDILMGLIKAIFFGLAIALVSCHRGLNSQAGAEGVGRAATESFVASFIVILVIDYFLTILLLRMGDLILPAGATRSII